MRTPKLALVIVMAAAAGMSCDDDKSSADGGVRTGGTGGSVSTGGTGGTATGGTTGGTTATGGTGGTTATGGTGGTTATGGTGGTAATGGTGGTAATGGTGGTSATGGTGGTPASCEIPCLTGLFTDCQPMGTCMSQTTLVPLAINQCYSNGVKVSISGSFTPGAAGNAVITYRKNGAVCYSIESPIDAAGASSMFTVKNAAGTAVATGTYGAGGAMPMITCTGGQTYTVSNPACGNVPRAGVPGQGGGDAGGGCSMGTCP